MIEEFFFDGVPIEPGDSAQPAGSEQAYLVVLAPGCVLAQVQLVGLPGQTAVADEKIRLRRAARCW